MMSKLEGYLFGNGSCSVIVYKWWLKDEQKEVKHNSITKNEMIYVLEQHECISIY